MIPASTALLSLSSLISVALLLAPSPRQKLLAQADPLAIKVCVNGLLFDRVLDNGRPSGARTIIDPRSAAIACQGVTTLDQARDIKICVNGLLFTNTFRDGSPAGSRTILDPRAAAIACAPCGETLPIDTSN